MKNFWYVLFVWLSLLALYLGLTANAEINNIIAGGILSVLVLILLHQARVQVDMNRLPAALVGVFRYTIYVIVDVIKCGVNVARIVIDPKLPIRPGIIVVKSNLSSELGTALSAHAITITPGEMVIEIGDDGVMYTHCLDAVSSAEGAEAAQKTRRDMLEKIFP
jgi:multicomponent Na+:H+ antiporter subunit E